MKATIVIEDGIVLGVYGDAAAKATNLQVTIFDCDSDKDDPEDIANTLEEMGITESDELPFTILPSRD